MSKENHVKSTQFIHRKAKMHIKNESNLIFKDEFEK